MLKASTTRLLSVAASSCTRASARALPLCTSSEPEQPGTNPVVTDGDQAVAGANPPDPEEIPSPKYDLNDYEGLREPQRFLKPVSEMQGWSQNMGPGTPEMFGGPGMIGMPDSPDAGMASGEFVQSVDSFDMPVLQHEPSEELVNKYLSQDCMNRGEIWKGLQKDARKSFQRHETDCGSSEVQVAILTQRIKQMEKHMITHRKDFSSRRGLEKMLNTRRKLLIYLRGKNFDKYCETIGRLGLKDSYIRQDRFAMYNAQKERRNKSNN